MARFTTRVELHVEEDEDRSEVYDTLHEAMEDEGFTRTLKDSDGKILKLPDAEYNYEGVITIAEVLAKAKSAAATTEHDSEILVTEAVHRKWHGLKKR